MLIIMINYYSTYIYQVYILSIDFIDVFFFLWMSIRKVFNKMLQFWKMEDGFGYKIGYSTVPKIGKTWKFQVPTYLYNREKQ